MALQVAAGVLIARLGTPAAMTGAATAFLAAALGVAGAGQLLGSLPGRRGGVPLIRGLAAMGSGLSGLPAPGDLAARLDAAGRPGGLGEREVMTAKLAMALIAASVGAVVGAAAPGRLGTVILVLAPASGFLRARPVARPRRARERDGRPCASCRRCSTCCG